MQPNLKPVLLRLIAPVCLTFSLTLASTAFADDTRSAWTTAARVKYQKASEAADRKDWVEARQLFSELWQESQTYDVASGLGQAEFKLGRRALGARYMALALKNIPIKEKLENRRRIESALTEMQAEVGTARISVDKAGAEVRADGESLGSAPLPIDVFLDPGSHLIEAELGQGRASHTLEVVPAGTYTVSLVLQATAPMPSAITQKSPWRDAPAPRTTPNAESAQPNWTPVLITGGLALAAAGVGAAFAFDAGSAKNKAKDTLLEATAKFGDSPCEPNHGGSSDLCSALREQQDQRKHSQTIAAVSFVASGVFAAAAIASYVWWKKPHPAEQSTPHVDAWVAPGNGGFKLQGTF